MELSLVANLIAVVANIATIWTLWFALRQWLVVRAADAAEAGLAQLDTLRGALDFVRGQAFIPELRETFASSEQRRRKVGRLLVQRWRERHTEVVQKTFKVGRLCEFRLGKDGKKAYELFQQLRLYLQDAMNAADVFCWRLQH